FLRGPNWTFYGPFEYWDFHKVVAENNINISEIVWVKALSMALPKNILVREVFGLILTFGYIIGGAVFITKKWGEKLIGQMGNIRYYLMVFLILGMMSLPIKMYLRWFFNLKYI